MKKKSAFDNFLDSKFIPLEKKFKLIIAAVLLILPLVLYFFVFYKPKTTEINNLITKKNTLDGQLQKDENLARNLAKYEEDLKRAMVIYAEKSRILPKEKEIPNLLKSISALGRGAGLDFLTFKPQADVPKDFYAEIPVEIRLRGPYHNMGAFLDQVSKLERLVTVSNIKMGSPQKEQGEMLLDSSCRLVTYRFTNVAIPQPTKK